MKFLPFVFALLFLASSAVQLNDPDGIYWFLGYLVLAIISVANGLGKVNPTWNLIVLSVLGAGVLFYAPGFYEFLTNQDGIAFSQGMQNDYPYIEEAREFGGLLIASICMLLMWRWSAKNQASA